MITDNKIQLGTYDSWEIISENIIIKTTDKSFFLNHGSGIPMGTRAFWSAEEIQPGERNLLTVIFEDNRYTLHIDCDKQKNPRTRLFWNVDLVNSLKKYSPYEPKEIKDFPLMRFERIGQDEYKMTPIVIEDVENYTILEEPTVETQYKEGSVQYRRNLAYKRNLACRMEAIKQFGLNCYVCGMNFEESYGPLGRGYIEIHHKKPLHTIGGETTIDPKTDLVPLCSNCHRMIHRDEKNDVEALKRIYTYYKKLKHQGN